MQKLLVVLCLFLLPGLAAAQSKSREQLLLDQKVPIYLKAFHVTGVAIAYIENDKIAWTAFYGDRIPGRPAAANTLYSVASLTKPITAEIALRLASENEISLDELIFSNWTDPDVAGNPWNKLLTTRLCLSHQTGFPNWRYQTQNHLAMAFEPGTQTSYSGEGYDYVGHYLEKKTGKPFEQLARQFVFVPINMKDTSYTPQPWWANRQAKPVESDPRTKWSADDLLRATVSDYANFIISVMHNERVTKEIAAQRLTITRNLTSPENSIVLCEAAPDPSHCHVSTGFGLGWHIVKINDELIVDHTGADADVKTLAFFLPAQHRGAVIFTNGPDVSHALIDKVLEVLYPNPVYAGTMW